jgi:hypothetical protein
MTENLMKHFTMGKWKDLDLWQCSECGFNTLEGEEAILSHLESAHFPPPKPVPPPESKILRVTRFGREVMRPDEPEVMHTEAELVEDGIDVSALNVDEVLSLVESGELDKKEVLESERAGKARKSLLEALEQEG